MSEEDGAASAKPTGRGIGGRVARLLSVGFWLLVAAGLAGFLGVREWEHEKRQGSLTFSLSSTAAGRVQVYYDRGAGFSESESTGAPLRIGTDLKEYVLPLPAGTFKSFRFDPLDGPGVLLVSDIQIRGFRNEKVLTLPLLQMKPNDQIESVTPRNDLFEIRTRPGVNDPSLYFEVRPGAPVNLTGHWWEGLVVYPGRFLLKLVAFGTLFWSLRSAVRHRGLLMVLASQRPCASLAAVALLASVLANYPVVFLGRSIVSPNNGTALLQNTPPTVPGATETLTVSPHGADNGAMMWQHLPYGAIQSRAFREGDLPLWNRYSSSGTTLLGQGQSMFGDPFHQLLVMAGGPSWAWDVKLVMARVWFGLGLGLVVWWGFRRLNPALIVAFFAPFSGFFTYRFAHPSLFSVGYAPWVLAGWVLFVTARERSRLLAGLALLVVSHWVLLTSGTVKEAYLSALFLDLAGFLAWFFSPSPATSRWKSLGLLLATGLAILFLTAPFWWTFLDALSKAKTLYENNIALQIERKLFLGFFDDLFYRVLHGSNGYAPSGNAVMLLGFCGALGSWWAWRRSGWFLGCLAALAGTLSFAFEVIPRTWILAMPFFKNVELVGLVGSAAALPLAWVCAGWGFVCLESAHREGRLRHTGIGLLCVLALIVVPYVAGFTYPASNYFLLNALLVALAVLATVVSWYTGFVPRGRCAGLGWVAVLVFSGVVVYRHMLHEIGWVGAGPLYTPMARVDLRLPSVAVEWAKKNTAEPFRSIGINENLMPGFSAVYGLEGINGPDALMSRAYRRLAVGHQLSTSGDWYFPFRAGNLASHAKVLDFLGVRYVFSNLDSLPDQAGVVRRFDGDLYVFERPTAWPRAFFTDLIAVYSKPEDLDRMIAGGDGRPFAARAADDAWVGPGSGDLSQRVLAKARDYQLLTNTTRFTVDAPKPGYAVLMETYSEGDFLVTVDGKRVPCLRVNEFAKAVLLVTPGEHRVEFTYWPRHFTTSLWLCLAGAAVFATTLRLASQLRISSESGSRPS